MRTIRLSLPTVLILVAVVGAGAFAAGQSLSPDSSSSPSSSRSAPAAMAAETAEPTETAENDEPLPPGHPPTGGRERAAAEGLPAGHPPLEPMDPAGGQAAEIEPPASAQTPLEWKAPARWQLVPNASAFRLATYRVPRAPGDAEDAELSVTRAGGSVDANAERWIGQFDPAGQKTAKRAKRNVGPLEVTRIDVQGSYAGGMPGAMGKGASGGAGWALLGAIVATPGMPHFFKLTGPARSVRAAEAEFDALIGSLVQP
jgi:hypothetical protein